MRCFLCLIGFIGIITVLQSNQLCTISKASAEAREMSHFESTANPPLSAIENSLSSISGFVCDPSTHLQKRSGMHFIARHSLGLRSFESATNNPYRFFVKSTSLFLLHHFSQSLWGVFQR